MAKYKSPSILNIPREVEEYKNLFKLPKLNDHQADRMAEILEQANTDRELNFWISHIICKEGKELGITSEERLEAYENQKARLREYLFSDIPTSEKEYWATKLQEEYKNTGNNHACELEKDSVISEEELQLCLNIIIKSGKEKAKAKTRMKPPGKGEGTKSIPCSRNACSKTIPLKTS